VCRKKETKMPENLLSISNINLFGLIMEDLDIVDPDRPWNVRLASAAGENIAPLSGVTAVDGAATNPGDFVLVWQQETAAENGIYRTQAAGTAWVQIPVQIGDFVVTGTDGRSNRLDSGKWKLTAANTFSSVDQRRPGAERRHGINKQLEEQLTVDAHFAKIYGFSFEGSYYDLPRPVVFLVHGNGELAAQSSAVADAPQPARAPRETDLTGLAATIFSFADELRVWSYDQADYTIRMDVDAGMFEDVLLAAMLGGLGGNMDISGMNARGINARGINVRGINVRGLNMRGINARGAGGNSD
jgi:hypothetical protein